MTNESYWTYRASTPTPQDAPEGLLINRQEWEQLSPGMRREIERQWKAKNHLNNIAIKSQKDN